MASTMHHIAIGQLYYEKYLSGYSEEEKNRFLLGTIAPDWSSEIKKVEGKPQKERKQSHFIDYECSGDKIDLKASIPNIELFKETYKKDLKDPFTLGYLIHLLTDKFWFEVVIPLFIKKNLIEINNQARVLEDLTNEEFINWYRNNIYDDFDIHNIIIGAMVFGEKVEFPSFLEFDLTNFIVEDIDIDCLKSFLEKNYERLKFVKTISDEEAMEQFLQKKKDIKVADLPTISEFINQCVDYCFDIINEE